MKLGPGLYLAASQLALAAAIIAFASSAVSIWFAISILLCAMGFAIAFLQEFQRGKRLSQSNEYTPRNGE